MPWHIVVVCCDYGRFLEEAVVSERANATDYALAIIDDASVDETPAVAEDLARRYPRISVLRNRERSGVFCSGNRAIASVDSSFVVLLDTDDRIGAGYLRAAERTLAAGCDSANPDAILFGDRVGRWRAPDVATLRMVMRHNRVHCCSAFRRCYWAQVGGFHDDVLPWEDYDLWLRMLAAGARIHAVRGGHFYPRQHPDSATKAARATIADVRRRFDRKHAALYGRAA